MENSNTSKSYEYSLSLENTVYNNLFSIHLPVVSVLVLRTHPPLLKKKKYCILDLTPESFIPYPFLSYLILPFQAEIAKFQEDNDKVNVFV